MITLTTPISECDVLSLKAGDKVLLNGVIYTARDQAHMRLINEDSFPFNIEGAVFYYVGPTPARPDQVIGSSGPTSSYRMDTLAIPLMKKGLKMMIGKGNRSEKFRQAMIKEKAIYLIATGGAGALLSSKIKSSKVIMYDDLGTEAIRELVVKDFPCFVAYDLNGNQIFHTGKNN
ncbi:MAG: FumA C-terminus/TtdB family hydratase beta subunit [Bacillota bacterium]